MMKALRAIGRWLRNVAHDVVSGDGGPPATFAGERLRQQQQVEREKYQ